MADQDHTKINEDETAAEVQDRGLFDFLGKKEEEPAVAAVELCSSYSKRRKNMMSIKEDPNKKLETPENYVQTLQVQPQRSSASMTSRTTHTILGTLPTGPVTKPIVENVSYIEPEYGVKLKTIISNIFPKDFLYIPESMEKTRLFYEFILVDTDSVEITHSDDPQNPEKYSYSKCKILKVLTLTDWNLNPFTQKTFSQPFIPNGYNYHDYQKAWHHAFLYSNTRHSWLFHFHNDIPRIFPYWFHQWWRYFGASELAYPLMVREGFEAFKEKYLYQTIPKLMSFSLMFKIPWILYWDFNITDKTETEPPILTRRWKVKWWKSIPETQASKLTVLKTLAETTIQNPTPQDFYNLSLPSASSKQEYKKKIIEALLLLGDEDEDEGEGEDDEEEEDDKFYTPTKLRS